MQTFGRRLGVGFASIDVPQLPVAATGTFASIRYSAVWLPLVEIFASRTKVWTPRASTIFFFLLFAVWGERLLAMLGMRRRILTAMVIAAAAASSIMLVAIAAVVFGFTSLIVLAPVSPQGWTIGRAVAAVCAMAVAAILVIYPTYSRLSAYQGMASGSGGLGSTTPPTLDGLLEMDEMSRVPGAAFVHAPQMKEGQSQEIYQGLPARFELPSGDRRTSFGTELLRVDRPQRIVVVMLSAALLWWLNAAMIALAGLLLWRERATLAAALHARFASPAAEPALTSA
jgi:hypothetical protein